MRRKMLACAAVSIALGVVVAGALVVLGRVRGWDEPQASGAAPTMRLMTHDQYVEVIHHVFGNDIDVEVTFPVLQRQQGLLAVGASAAEVAPAALEQFERSARAIASQVFDERRRGTLVSCSSAEADHRFDAACASKFFARVGRLLYRRPLAESDLQMQVAVAAAVAERLGDPYAGLGYGLAGMLVSPRFLYISEVAEPDPQRPGSLRLDAYSKATRLSLFLWNAFPDEELLQAAESGALHKKAELNAEIERMLASPRLEKNVRAFFSDFLAFNKFDTLSKDPVIYPAFTGSIARAAQEQALRLIVDHLMTQKGDYRDLFTTSRTFIDGTLGPLYQVPVASPVDWTPIDLDATRSAGLLTSLSFLALNAHPGRSSPTLRGKAIREILLCQKVPDPPPNVNFALFQDPDQQFKTTRDRLSAHSSDPVCAGCHKLTDPIGLALENFDGAGQFRAQENQMALDVSGNLDGTQFVEVAGLGRALHDHPALAPCLASRLFAYGVGRELQTADRAWLAYIVKRFAAVGYRVPELMREIAASDAFFAIQAPAAGKAITPSTASTANDHPPSNRS